MAIITPFNFPLEIPALQLMGALFMGNKPLLHVDRRCPDRPQPCCVWRAMLRSSHSVRCSVPSPRSISGPNVLGTHLTCRCNTAFYNLRRIL